MSESRPADPCHEAPDAAGAVSRVLWAVLAINAAMFVVELGAGLAAHSTALLADSLDMLGDAWVYAISLLAVRRSARWRAGASLAKGGFMALVGLVALGEAVWKLAAGLTPQAPVMGAVGALALAANAACAVLLLRFRHEEINLRSAWLCARNDVLANAGVLLAAAGVAWSGSPWPDAVIGAAIAAVFLRSAAGILAESWRSLFRQAGDAA